MKKTDKSIWNNTWNKSQGRVSIGYMDILIFREITKFINVRGKEIIELGCGRGVLSFLMLKNRAKAVSLVDSSDSALNLAKKLIGDACIKTKYTTILSLAEFQD